MNVIVVVIVDAIVVEPRLDAFGEVFVVIGGGVFPFPQAFGESVVVGLF